MLFITSVLVATFVSVVGGTSFRGTGLKQSKELGRVLQKKQDRINEATKAIGTISETLGMKETTLDQTRHDLSAAKDGRDHESGVVAELTEQKERLQRANEATIEKRKRLDRLLRVQKKRNNEIVKGRDLIGFVNRLDKAGYSCGLTTQGHGSHATLELDGHKSTVSGKMRNMHLLQDIHDAMPDLLQNQNENDAPVTEDEIQANWVELQKHRSVLAEIDQDLDSLGVNVDQLESEIEDLRKDLKIKQGIVEQEKRSRMLLIMVRFGELFINDQSHGRPQIAWDVYDTLMDDLSFLGSDEEFKGCLRESIEKRKEAGRLGAGISVWHPRFRIQTNQRLRMLRCFDALAERFHTQGLPDGIALNENVAVMHIKGLRSIEEASEHFDQSSIQELKNIPSDEITKTLELMAEVESNYPSVDDETRLKRDSIYGVIPQDHPEYYGIVQHSDRIRLHRIYQNCGCELSIGDSSFCWAIIAAYQNTGNEQAMMDLIEEAVRNERYFFHFGLSDDSSPPHSFGAYLITRFTIAARNMLDSFDPDSEMLRKLDLGRKLLGNEAWKLEKEDVIAKLVGWHLNNDRRGLALEEFVKVDSKTLRKQYRSEWTKPEIQAAEQEWHTRKHTIDAAQCRDHAHSLHQRFERVKKMTDRQPWMFTQIHNDLEKTEQMFLKAGLDRTHPGWMNDLSDAKIRVQESIQQTEPAKVTKSAKKKKGKK